MKKYQYASRLKFRSRKLRKESTEAEKLLWSQIRGRQLEGYKFRRQFPIDNFILDFYSISTKLGIELDGGQHSNPAQLIYDQQRTKKLESQGIKIIRFWDNEVFENLEGVLEVILRELNNRQGPPPASP